MKVDRKLQKSEPPKNIFARKLKVLAILQFVPILFAFAFLALSGRASGFDFAAIAVFGFVYFIGLSNVLLAFIPLSITLSIILDAYQRTPFKSGYLESQGVNIFFLLAIIILPALVGVLAAFAYNKHFAKEEKPIEETAVAVLLQTLVLLVPFGLFLLWAVFQVLFGR